MFWSGSGGERARGGRRGISVYLRDDRVQVASLMDATARHRENNNEEPEDYPSLEFEEDSYIAFAVKSETPSFDPEDPNWVDDDDCMFVIVDEDFDEPNSSDVEESCRVEAEFFDKRTGRNKFIRGVRVKFQDLSKPYLAKITSQKNYYKFLQLVKGGIVMIKLERLCPYFLAKK